MPVASPPYSAMDPFSETARATRSISEPLTKAEREALAMSAVTAAADATRKAGDGESAQASASRSAEEAVHQATHVRLRWLWFHTCSSQKQIPTRLARRKVRRRRRRSPAVHLARRARCHRSTWRASRPTPKLKTTRALAPLRRRGCVPCMAAAHSGARGPSSPLLTC